jgi:uroporphyrinogen decarboxylase
MDEMTKYERMLKTMRCEEVDRLPWSTYLHSSVHDRGVPQFANFTLNFYHRFDTDYIKVMMDENYDAPVNIQYCWDINVWKKLEPLEPHTGGFGRQIENLKIIKDKAGPDVPVLQTLYSPFHWAWRLNRQFAEHYREDAAIIDQGVSTIPDSLLAFVKACINEAGIDGFFYGLWCCDPSLMTEAEFKQWSVPHDLKVFAAMRESPMVINHIHGARNIFFDACKDFDCDALSWEDRTSGPSITEARKKTRKSLVGGINIEKAVAATAEEVYNEGMDAIRQAGGKGLVLAPGCTLSEKTPAENMFALKRAVHDYARKH